MSNQQPSQEPYNTGTPQQPYPYQQQSGMPPQGYQMPPGYQQPMQQPPKKKIKWPWVAGGCAFVALLLVGGCVAFTGVVANSNLATTTAATNTTGSSSSSSTSTIAKVGETITVDQVNCTLVSVKMLQADQYNTPKAGNQFIVAHITIKNASATQVAYNPLDFHIKSSTGNVIDTGFMTPSSYTANNQLNSGNLDPNGSVSGDIIMQAPVNDAKAELTWAASIFANNTQYGWTLGTY